MAAGNGGGGVSAVFGFTGNGRDGGDDQNATMMRRRHRRYPRFSGDNPLVFEPPIRTRHHPRQPLRPPPAREINPLMLRFLFSKKLHNSDVSPAGRIVIPKGSAEMHLPTLHDKEGFWMHLYDFSLVNVWTLKFRFWPNNRSRMYVFENTKEFVNAHELMAGDFIEVFKDEEHDSFVLRGMKKGTANAASHDDHAIERFFATVEEDMLASPFPFGNHRHRDNNVVPEIEPNSSIDFSLLFG